MITKRCTPDHQLERGALDTKVGEEKKKGKTKGGRREGKGGEKKRIMHLSPKGSQRLAQAGLTQEEEYKRSICDEGASNNKSHNLRRRNWCEGVGKSAQKEEGGG